MHNNLQKIILVVTFWLILLWPSLGQAAVVRVETGLSEVKTGEYFTTYIAVSSDDLINGVEGYVTYPDQILFLESINDGDSQINLWVERPKQTADGVVRFAGITPGGFSGQNIRLFSLVFKGVVATDAEVGLDRIKVYLNDGQGSLVAAQIQNQRVSISDIGGYAPQPQAFDYEPPESFIPQISSDQTVFDGKWFIAFATQDKGQGMAYYQVKESRSKFLALFMDWRKVTSPYILTDQELKSYVWIRAYDRAGNYRQVAVEPTYSAAWYENFAILAIIIVVIVLLFGIYLLSQGRKWKTKIKLPRGR